jgi:hypothetical protein
VNLIILMSNDNEFKKLQKFIKFLETDNKDNSQFIKFVKSKVYSMFSLKYFEFIPKDNTIKSKENLNLCLDLLGLAKMNEFKSYVYAFNFLYFALLFDNNRKIFSLRMLFTLMGTSLLIFIQQFYFYENINKALKPILSEDVKFLYKDLNRKREGYEDKVYKNKF